MPFLIDQEAEVAPSRSPLVTAATAILTGITACLALVTLVYLWHLLTLKSDMDQAGDIVGAYPGGSLQIGFYEHDAVPVIAGVVLIILLARQIPRLVRGSSSARTTTIVLSLLLAVGCLGSYGLWGATTIIHKSVTGGTLGDDYMNQFAYAQRADLPSWTDGLLAFAIAAIPLAVIVFAILLLLPQVNEYFAAMRRSGQY